MQKRIMETRVDISQKKVVLEKVDLKNRRTKTKIKHSNPHNVDDATN
jgi:hypothetical protein